jgi:asparagine synthetase B (glutamine-hydrolysing)
LYDAACHELLVQRDPGGARALYFRVEPAGCWFASDESALLEGDLDAALDPAALVRYFAAWAPQPGWGWFRDVQAVRPGEQWSFNGVRATLQQTLRPPRIVPAKRDAQAIEQYAELLRQAVARSVAGVVGVPALSLSSGLDSQTVAAQLHLLQQPFVAHSWILPSHPASDETDGIHGLIEAWGVPWRHFDGSGAEPLGTDQQWPRPQVCGELFANLYRELKHRLYKSVRADGQRLLLNGDAGDHLYGNPVDWFVHSLQAHRYADVLGELAARVRAQGFALRRDPALRRMASWLLQRRVRNYAPQDFTAPAARTLLDGARLEFADSRERLLLGTYTTRALAAESAYSEPLGLEIRSPLRDPDLLGFALQLRPALSQRAGERKWVARAALRGQLPEESRTRQKSGDLSHFLRASLRGPLLQRWRNLLDQPNARWSQIVQRSSVEHTLAYAQSASETALLRLWLCVAFEQWRSACAYGTQVPTMEVVPSTART